MPSINAALVPSIPPGNLFTRFVEDTRLSVRWMTAVDPAYYEAFNRPIVDVALRQLILAKAVDGIESSMGFLSVFPFVNQPRVENGSQIAGVPIRLFWDMHASLPNKWSNVRLARVDRLDGSNGNSSDSSPVYIGTLRFIFSGNEVTDGSESSTETALFYVDYEIDSTLTYQIVRIQAASHILGFSATILDGEANTIGGTITFKTVSTSDIELSQFLDVVAPGTGAQYWVVSTSGSDSDDDFSRAALIHGTGLLAVSAYSAITTLESDPLNWIDSFNYPFALDATRESGDSSVAIPTGLFTEFDITVPAGDAPSSGNNGTYYPVWISKLERDGDNFIFTFSTYNVTDTAPDAALPIEFATLTLQRALISGNKVAIVPIPYSQLLNADNGTRTNAQLDLWTQHFGRGHVILSRKWDVTGGTVDSFFDSLPEVSNGITTVVFNAAATAISSFACSRVPKYITTKGQSQALIGTVGDPGASNRFITETDEGLGTQLDLEAQSGVISHVAISRYGNIGTRTHKCVKLVVDPAKVGTSSNFYETEILPRLTLLLGRAPQFSDEWYNGTRFMRFNGDSWVGTILLFLLFHLSSLM